jgi:hypothetical protein
MSKSRLIPDTYSNADLRDALAIYSKSALAKIIGKHRRSIDRYLLGPGRSEPSIKGTAIPFDVQQILKQAVRDARDAGYQSKTPYFDITTLGGKETRKVLANGQLSDFVDIDVEGMTGPEVAAILAEQWEKGEYSYLRITSVVAWDLYFQESNIRRAQIEIPEYKIKNRDQEIGYKMGGRAFFDTLNLPTESELIETVFFTDRTPIMAGTITLDPKGQKYTTREGETFRLPTLQLKTLHFKIARPNDGKPPSRRKKRRKAKK